VVYSSCSFLGGKRLLTPRAAGRIAARKERPTPQARPEPAAGAKTILLVDDNLPAATTLRHQLLALGYYVHVAGSGNAALDWLAYKTPDLVILDVVMPIMSGIEVCRWIRANPTTRRVPVVFLSARAGTREMTEASNAGGSAYVLKFTHIRRLLAVIRTFLPDSHAAPVTPVRTSAPARR
jgi:DNA-binding response OmpR family regulator